MDKSEKDLLVEINDKIERLNDKQDRLNDKVHSIDLTTTKQELNLEMHMKRTDIAEARLDAFETKVAPALDAYKFIATILKIIVPIAGCIGAYYEFFKDKY